MSEKDAPCIETLSAFLEWAERFKDEQYLFRGVSNRRYGIQASAYRRLPCRDQDNPSELLKLNEELIEKARSRGHDQRNGQRLSDLELLAELQHFGAATCLIDFTRSALVALWFACQQSCKGEANGKVFAICCNDTEHFKTVETRLLQNKIGSFFNFDEGNENHDFQLYQWEPKHQNNRIIAQHSVFVLDGAPIEADDECIIKKDSKKAILDSLEAVSNIREASMYLDFDGFARLHAHNEPHSQPDAEAYLQRGIEAFQRDDLEAAIKYYDRVISFKPAPSSSTVAKAYYNRGRAARSKGNYDRSIEDFDQAIKRTRDYDVAYFGRGLAHHKKGEYDHAINDYAQALKLKPRYVLAYSYRGRAYSSRARRNGNKDDYSHAINDHSTAIKLRPAYAIAYFRRGYAYSGKDDFDKAINDYTSAISLNPNLAWSYYRRAMARLCSAEWDNARLDLIEAKTRGIPTITQFRKDYNNISDFERRFGVELPEDIAAMLTT